MLHLALATLLAFSTPPFAAAQGELPSILSMRERAEFRDRVTLARLEQVVPALMRRENVDLWVLFAREYNEDPVVKTMLPATWLSARRRTILVLNRTEEGVERLAVSRYDVGQLFASAWNPEEQPDQWARLAQIIEERDPASIAWNVSPTFALADGVTHSEGLAFVDALPEKYRERLVGGERLAVGWLERRTPLELGVYPKICRIAHAIIAEGFSADVIQPGRTTTSDVEWWYRERFRELGLDTWFHPSVSLQRAAERSADGSFSKKPEQTTIERGDLLHVDLGITYLALNTDTQQHAYVLRADETDAPAGLKAALARGNELQDILTSQFRIGRTGNEILALALEQAQREQIDATIYTHPLGLHGHGAGPTIGLWDQQGGVPGRGDYPLFDETVHSIELNAAVAIPEWDDQVVRIMLEEDAYFNGQEVRYLDGRQTSFILIDPK